MKQNRTSLVLFSVLAVLTLVLSACGPKEPVTLQVTGMVDTIKGYTYSGLNDMNVVTLTVEHPKNGPTEYTGVYLVDILKDAGVQSGATTLVMTADDGYAYEADLATVLACADCLITFGDEEGKYNAAMPGLESKAWVKGIVSIEVK
jgi:hypothetical protein